VRFLLLTAATMLVACATFARTPSPATTRVGPTSCAGRASTDSNVYDTTQVAERPIVRNAPPPPYPRRERDHGVQGRVVVALVVKGDGFVDSQSVRLIRKVHPALDRAVVKSAFTAQFWPACLNEQPVAVLVAVPIEFKITRH